MAVASRPERSRLARVGRVVGHYIRGCQVRRQRVFINVPPAMARHLLLKPANGVIVVGDMQQQVVGHF